MADVHREQLDPAYWGEELDPSRVVNPVVFNFVPNKYLKVSNDRLADWEQLFADKVGFPPNIHQGRLRQNESISGSNGDWDDCDMVN